MWAFLSEPRGTRSLGFQNLGSFVAIPPKRAIQSTKGPVDSAQKKKLFLSPVYSQRHYSWSCWSNWWSFCRFLGEQDWGLRYPPVCSCEQGPVWAHRGKACPWPRAELSAWWCMGPRTRASHPLHLEWGIVTSMFLSELFWMEKIAHRKKKEEESDKIWGVSWLSWVKGRQKKSGRYGHQPHVKCLIYWSISCSCWQISGLSKT